MRFGDVPGGAIGGSGQGATLQANTILQTGTFGYLSVQEPLDPELGRQW